MNYRNERGARKQRESESAAASACERFDDLVRCFHDD